MTQVDSGTPTDRVATPTPLGVLLLFTGDLFRVEPAMWRTCASLLGREDEVEIVCVLDGPRWTTLPGVQVFLSRTSARLVELDEIADHPGVLMNEGLKLVEAPHLALLWPGALFRPGLHREGSALLDRAPDAGVAYSRLRRRMAPSYPRGLRLDYGHLQQADLISPYGATFRTESVRRVGGCDPAPVFQRCPGWDLMLRIARDEGLLAVSPLRESVADLRDAGHLDGPDPEAELTWEWDRFPFVRTLPFGVDRIHRAMLGPRSLDGDPPRRGLPGAGQGPGGRTIRVTVTGGAYEPVHNQLCFFNYFECPEGVGLFDWKTIHDRDATLADVEGSDLVIIARGRCENAAALARGCRERGIPTLYMLDDNWLTVGLDWPQYREVFSPGRPDYEAFLDTLRHCSAAIVYSDLIRDRIEEHAQRIYKIDCNITIEGGLPADGSDRDLFVIGYAGSARYTEAAFTAVRQFVEDVPRSRLLLFGDHVPSHLDGLVRRGRAWIEPSTNYGRHRDRLAALRPDVLIAPLDISETSMSKCPNKFLEITAAGAVGVYTGIRPYTDVVEGGVHGVLIPPDRNDDPRAWREAYDLLARDDRLRRSMREAAWDRVAMRYETSRVFPQFLAVIEDLLGEEARPSGLRPAALAPSTASMPHPAGARAAG